MGGAALTHPTSVVIVLNWRLDRDGEAAVSVSYTFC